MPFASDIGPDAFHWTSEIFFVRICTSKVGQYFSKYGGLILLKAMPMEHELVELDLCNLEHFNFIP